MDFKIRYQYNAKTDLLGRGGFAIVYKAQDTLLNRTVALKFFTNSGSDKHTLIQEISRAIALEHVNLCRYYDAAVLETVNMHGDAERTEVGVMEYIDGGELKFFLSKQNQHFDKLLMDILNGISYLHKRNIIHRDLKPQNILVKNTEEGPIAKITDFGISKNISAGNTSSSQLMGTVEYMAPEQFSPAKYGVNGKISTNLDLWSFGLMVYELLAKETMFGSRGGQSSAEEVMSNILSESLVEEKIAKLPAKYRELVSRCLIKDAKQRVQNAAELMEMLKEPQEPAKPAPSAGAPTAVIPNGMPKADNPTVAINATDGRTTVVSQPASTSAPSSAPKPAKPQVVVKKRSNAAIYIIIIVLAIAAGGGYYYWQNQNSGKGDYDYAVANKSTLTPSEYADKLKSASNAGYDSASLKLGEYYFDKKNYDQALTSLKPLVDKKDTAAITLRNKAWYENGMIDYNKAKYTTAKQWFDKGADVDDPKAQCMLGTIYLNALGVPKNDNESFRWYLKSADKKNEVAVYAVGLCYADGIGTQRDPVEARKFLNWTVTNAKAADVRAAAKNKLKEL